MMLPLVRVDAQKVALDKGNEFAVEQIKSKRGFTKRMASELGLLKKSNKSEVATAVPRSVSMTTETGKTITGFLLYDEVIKDYTFVDFSTTEPETLNLVGETQSSYMYHGVWVNGYCYTFMYDTDDEGNVETSYWVKIDNVNYDFEILEEYSEEIGFSDMTYDYENSTAFYVAGMQLGIVDLTDGDYVSLAEHTANLYTVACDNSGCLWVVDAAGDLYTCDANEGTFDLIGSTGVEPLYVQDMEFDLDDNTLYWAVCNSSDEGYLATVNTTTGEATKIGTLGTEAEVVALHIPATPMPDGACAEPEMMIEVGDKGALTAEVLIEAPQYDIKGNDLVSIDTLVCERDGERIYALANAAIDTLVLFDDLTIAESGLYTYETYAINEFGKGKVTRQTVYVGVDIPEPKDIVLFGSADTMAVLTWDLKSVGINGGYVDTANVEYAVMRLTDSVIVVQGSKDMTYTEKIGEMALYQYRVFAQYVGGEAAGYANSNSVVIGPAFDIPVELEVLDDNDFGIWTVIDANNDELTWSLAGEDVLYAQAGDDGANDWLISPALNMEEGKTYKLSFLYQPQNFLLPPNEDFNIYLGQGETVNDMTVELKAFECRSSGTYLGELFFTAPSTGEFNLGWHLKSAVSQDWMSGLLIADIAIENTVENDMAALEIASGQLTPMSGDKCKYTVYVKNMGTEAQNNYEVKLYDPEGLVLGSTPVTNEIAPLKAVAVDVEWTAAEKGLYNLRAGVVLAGDENDENDVTEDMYEVEVQDGSEGVFRAGSDDIPYYGLPFNFYYEAAYNQILYIAEETGMRAGNIQSLTFFLSEDNEEIATKDNVSIYITSVDNTEMTGWIDINKANDLVYNGTITTNISSRELVIDLDKPHFHKGGNMLITIDMPLQDGWEYYDGIDFLLSATDDARAMAFESDDNNFSKDSEEAAPVNGYPNIRVAMNEISDPTSTDDAEMNRLSVYPNPVNNVMYIDGMYDRAEVFNAAGQKVLDVNTMEMSVDVSTLNSGVYFVKIYRDGGVETHKVVK